MYCDALFAPSFRLSEKVAERQKSKILGYEFQTYERISFKDYAQAWLEEKVKVQNTPSTYSNYERQIRLHFYPSLGKLYLDQISRKHADKIIDKLLKKGHSPNGINKIMQTLRAVLFDAEKTDALRKSPLKDYPLLKVSKRPPTFWGNMEIKQFLESCRGHHLYPLFVVALNTGMRRGELTGLCWDRVDFSRRMIEVSRIRDRFGFRNTTKSGIARHIPINKIVEKTLMNLFQNKTSKFVFTRSDGEPVNPHHIYRDFKRAQKRAEIENSIRFHDLRHCFASHFMMNGGNLYDLQKILGHSKFEMTQIYAHLSPDHLADTTQIISFE